MRIQASVLVTFLIFAACGDDHQSQTVADAIALGLQEVKCEEPNVGALYAVPDSTTPETVCAAIIEALRAAETSGLVAADALNADSVDSVVVLPVAFESVPSRESFPDSGVTVTIDLVHRSHNLFVMWPGIDRSIEVSWTPEGLAY